MQVKSTEWCEYLMVRVLPQYYLLPELAGEDVRNQLCKLTAELAAHLGQLKVCQSYIYCLTLLRFADPQDPGTAAKNVFDRLIDYMPLPPATEDGSLAEVPNLEFTKVQCKVERSNEYSRVSCRWRA